MTLWFWSDPHFSHGKLIDTFKAPDGSPARKFKDVEEMDEILIINFNARVRPQDHAYCLGDVTFSVQALRRIMPRLNGHHRLLFGNHDNLDTRLYFQFFDKLMSYRVFDKIIFSHIPLAPWSVSHKIRANVHGHCHLAKPLIYQAVDPDTQGRVVRYVHISAEQVNYTPLSLEEINQLVDQPEPGAGGFDTLPLISLAAR